MKITDKINFKQPQYMLPAIVYIPLLATGYFVCDMFATEVADLPDKNLQTTEFLNPELPGAQIKDDGIGGKYENMAKAYGRIADYSAVDNIERDTEEEYAQAFVRQDIVEELRRDGLTIPQNVIIIGTVNMDDTTNSFSRKVIDRAMTFETIVNEFDDSYFDSDVALNYVSNPRKGELFISDEVRATQMLEDGNFTLTDEEQQKILSFINSVNHDLEGSPFKISYRILNETILLYRAKKEIERIMKEDGGFEEGVTFHTDLNSVFDEILMQKVLPRIEGDYEKCSKCLTELSKRADDNNWKQSMDKIEFMIARFGKDKSGFTSFWN